MQDLAPVRVPPAGRWRQAGSHCAYRTGWDHDHCAFCWRHISIPLASDDQDAVEEGYATDDGCHWACEPCFADFQARFQWTTDWGRTILALGSCTPFIAPLGSPFRFYVASGRLYASEADHEVGKKFTAYDRSPVSMSWAVAVDLGPHGLVGLRGVRVPSRYFDRAWN